MKITRETVAAKLTVGVTWFSESNKTKPLGRTTRSTGSLTTGFRISDFGFRIDDVVAAVLGGTVGRCNAVKLANPAPETGATTSSAFAPLSSLFSLPSFPFPSFIPPPSSFTRYPTVRLSACR